MGWFSARKQRKQAHEQQIRDDAYRKAIDQGQTPEQANLTAERAVRRRRRIRRAAIISAVGK